MRSAIRRVLAVLDHLTDRYDHFLVLFMGIVECVRGEMHWGVTWIILSFIIGHLNGADEA